jgi:hypothetical protein
LNVPITCWCLWAQKPSSHHQQMLGFASTASLVGSGEKLGTDLQIGQLVCCGLCREPFFS